MRSVGKKKKNIEFWPMCSVLIKYCIYDGQQGYYATMALYGLIQIDSIFWNMYKTSPGDCCSGYDEQTCTIPCDFSLDLFFSDDTNITSKYIRKNTEKVGYYGFTFAFNFEKIREDNFLFIFSIKHQMRDDNIDGGFFSNFQNTPNKLYNLKNFKGYNSNIVMNVSYGHFCKGYTSNNCKYRCSSIDGIEHCAYDSGVKICINGATDKNTCEKNITKFRKKIFKCHNDICNNNGLCFVF
ncbi:hypothetical protein HZS_2255 [Henneguya salminicola]|nr:hypothetical protein HZS_2255 [Henneguya salminicola]